jgi:NADPH-dependent 2,4-dienoyl-CoA reductase/sulfur reductase-like enzyme
MDFSHLHYYVPIPRAIKPKVIKRDLIVYGATPAGITAAIQAKRMGLTVIIAEFGSHIGGMTASGFTIQKNNGHLNRRLPNMYLKNGSRIMKLRWFLTSI